jgi:hypothetical protein
VEVCQGQPVNLKKNVESILTEAPARMDKIGLLLPVLLSLRISRNLLD